MTRFLLVTAAVLPIIARQILITDFAVLAAYYDQARAGVLNDPYAYRALDILISRLPISPAITYVIVVSVATFALLSGVTALARRIAPTHELAALFAAAMLTLLSTQIDVFTSSFIQNALILWAVVCAYDLYFLR